MLGESVFTQHPIVYIGVALVVAVHYMMRRTSAGLSLRAAGEKPAALDAAGVSVDRDAYLGHCRGRTGSRARRRVSVRDRRGHLHAVHDAGPGLHSDRDAMLARGAAPWTIVGSLLFGMSLSIATALQLIGVEISTDYVQMLPFIAVIVVLVLFARRSYLPSALALPYFRGER